MKKRRQVSVSYRYGRRERKLGLALEGGIICVCEGVGVERGSGRWTYPSYVKIYEIAEDAKFLRKQPGNLFLGRVVVV